MFIFSPLSQERKLLLFGTFSLVLYFSLARTVSLKQISRCVVKYIKKDAEITATYLCPDSQTAVDQNFFKRVKPKIGRKRR